MKEKVLNKLKELNIDYKEIEHTPVYTIEDMDNLGNIFENAKICKNLFVRDQKGKRHFLVVLPEEKRAPLADIATKIGSTKLSFASEERLMKYLKLEPGAVTPLAVINDEANEVEVVFDEDLKKEAMLGVHPCVNTATILLTPTELEKYVTSNNNKLKYIKI
ncbi:MAG: prolyl-tRNA synthetase associated domain-containing protein [Clostridia bacterium]|nr:prolyl-tRNA synthetase associated domain-containing protein [Clostridia bacterium]